MFKERMAKGAKRVNSVAGKTTQFVLAALAGSILALSPASAQAPDFIAPAMYPTGGGSSYAAVGDFNGDRLPDIATVESGALGIAILLGKPDGSLQALVPVYTGTFANSIATADFNADGMSDVVLTNGSSAMVLLSTGGGFASPTYVSTSVAPNYVATGDFNRDGKTDLAVAGATGTAVLLGNGLGGFTPRAIMPQVTPGYYLLAADFNNDGMLDLLGHAAGMGQFYPGRGDGTFGMAVSTVAIQYGSAMADLNRDGLLDLVMMGALHRQDGDVQMVSTYMGRGDGSFLGYYNLVLSAGASIGLPVAGDFNADGLPDVAVRRGSPSGLLVLAGKGDLTLQYPSSFDSGPVPGGTLISADIDGNGSKDLMLLSPASICVFRNTHGNPPLVSLLKLTPSSVVGSTRTQAMVQLGGPAPAGGAAIRLSSSNPAQAFFLSGPTVTIPAGATSASVDIATTAVSTATAVILSASWNSSTQMATLNVVPPYTLTGLAINPSSQFGGFTVDGVLTLSGPSDSAATVSLNSANRALASVQPSVTIPAGAASATFPITLGRTATDTTVSISASFGGVTRTASLTVLKPLDTVRITKALAVVKSTELRVDATSTNANATLTVWNAATGAFIGTMSNDGRGKFSGRFTVAPAAQLISVKSSFGGFTTGSVEQK
jgi:hypothetical protein